MTSASSAPISRLDRLLLDAAAVAGAARTGTDLRRLEVLACVILNRVKERREKLGLEREGLVAGSPKAVADASLLPLSEAVASSVAAWADEKAAAEKAAAEKAAADLAAVNELAAEGADGMPRLGRAVGARVSPRQRRAEADCASGRAREEETLMEGMARIRETKAARAAELARGAETAKEVEEEVDADKDWVCPSCGKTNSSTLRRCGKPCCAWRGGKRKNIRKEANGPVQVDASWNCDKCGKLIAGNLYRCTCKRWKGGKRPKRDISLSPDKKKKKITGEDWKCSTCGVMNANDRVRCGKPCLRWRDGKRKNVFDHLYREAKQTARPKATKDSDFEDALLESVEDSLLLEVDNSAWV